MNQADRRKARAAGDHDRPGRRRGRQPVSGARPSGSTCSLRVTSPLHLPQVVTDEQGDSSSPACRSAPAITQSPSRIFGALRSRTFTFLREARSSGRANTTDVGEIRFKSD